MFEYYLSRFTSQSAGVAPAGVWLLNLLLVVFLVTCAYTDGTRGKIYNKVTFPAMLAGILLHGIFGGIAGLAWSAVGLLVGLGIQFLPFALNLAKAGDVKLLMAVGALKGWAFCTFGFLYGAIAFGLITLPSLWRKGELAEVGSTVKSYMTVAVATQGAPEAPAPVTRKKYVPWGVGLSLGFLLALVLEVAIGRAFWIDPFWMP